MAFILRDKVQETTTTTGTGAITLAGAVTGYQAFSAVCSIGDTVWYSINHSATAWETGLGTYSSANTLTRTTVYESSNGGSAVNFGSGTKTVTIDFPASKASLIFGSSGEWRGLFPRGYIDGCIVSNGTDTTNDINISAGVCRDSTNAVDITVAAMAGKQLDANWAPGASAGMRNSAAAIDNGTYHIYAVSKADGTQDVYAHTSLTVATVITALQSEAGGANYIYARRIASIIRASGAILGFTQRGDRFSLTTIPALDIDNPGLGMSSSTYTLERVPTGLELLVHMNVAISHGSTSPSVYFRHPSDADMAPTLTVSPLSQIRTGAAGATGMAEIAVYCNTSAQIAARSNATSTGFWGAILGWTDLRGKDV